MMLSWSGRSSAIKYKTIRHLSLWWTMAETEGAFVDLSSLTKRFHHHVQSFPPSHHQHSQKVVD